ncbi:transglutaminase family protein [Pseudarthrobacter sp. P1]|uniref:transglutaminase family protein n=1 Tax=Pseudarthrobacter sp. P1 TaxID=3418418 RepID=UPI003CF558D3
MTRLKIVHTTRFLYNTEVRISYNEARMTPLAEPSQVLLEASLQVSPPQASISNFRDYWGTRVAAFDMQAPHDRLEVRAATTVEVHRAQERSGGSSGWDALAAAGARDRFSDWIPQSALSGPGEEVSAIVADATRGMDPQATARAVFEWMRGEMAYVKGTTGVTTNAAEAWLLRQGVCQDLAHLAIGALRSRGIPARYVSGYLHPLPLAPIGESVAGESHAWLEWWDGEWRSWDPTNHTPAGNFHVSVARGRDYSDVPPLKGILSGGGGSTLEVGVDLTRLA